MRAIVNTYYSMTACVVATIGLAPLLSKHYKINMVSLYELCMIFFQREYVVCYLVGVMVWSSLNVQAIPASIQLLVGLKLSSVSSTAVLE